MKNILYKILLCSFYLLSLLIVISKVSISSDHNFGDFAVFSMVHELMSHNHKLYQEVFDHKDIGFYFFNHFFYNLGKLSGIYLFAFISCCAYFLGLFLILKKLFSSYLSSIFATLGTLNYFLLIYHQFFQR